MAMLNESNLLAMKAKAAKFRTHHIGTKLNEAELHEFEALAEKRKQSPSELIRGLALFLPGIFFVLLAGHAADPTPELGSPHLDSEMWGHRCRA